MNSTFLSYAGLSELAKYKSDKYAVSMYIYCAAGDIDRDLMIRYESLCDRVKKEASKFGLKDKQLKKICQKLEDNRKTLLDRFVANKAKTYCMFLSDDYEKFVEIPIRTKEAAVVNYEFYTLPLLSLLEQFERFSVLVFDRRNARLFNYYLQNLEEEESVFHNYVIPKFNTSTGSWKGLQEKKVSHKIDDSYHRHLKEVSRLVFESFKRFGFDKLLIASQQPELNTIKRHLHSYLLSRIAGEFTANVIDGTKTIKEKTEHAIEAYRKNKEAAKVQDLLTYRAHSKAVVGIEDVSEALTEGKVRQLVLTDDFHVNGYICPQEHIAAESDGSGNRCRLCGEGLKKQTFLEDKIIEEAFSQRAEIFHIFHHKEMLAKYNIGAILRF